MIRPEASRHATNLGCRGVACAAGLPKEHRGRQRQIAVLAPGRGKPRTYGRKASKNARPPGRRESARNWPEIAVAGGQREGIGCAADEGDNPLDADSPLQRFEGETGRGPGRPDALSPAPSDKRAGPSAWRTLAGGSRPATASSRAWGQSSCQDGPPAFDALPAKRLHL